MATTITRTAVKPVGQTPFIRQVKVAEAVQRGDTLYEFDSGNNTYKRAKNDGTESEANASLYVLTPAGANGYAVCVYGNAVIHPGFTPVVGTPYYLGAAGEIELHSGLAAGDRVTCLGHGGSIVEDGTTIGVITLDFTATGDIKP